MLWERSFKLRKWALLPCTNSKRNVKIHLEMLMTNTFIFSGKESF